MSAPLSILMLSHLASTEAPTGAEHSLSLLARGLARRGHRVRVVIPGPWALREEVESAGVVVDVVPCRVCWLTYYRPKPLPVALLKWARFARPDPGAQQLASLIRQARPDVVHVNCLPHVRGAASAKAAGVPLIWHLREILPAGRRRRWFGRRLSRHATRIVAVSDAVGRWVRDEGLSDRLEVVHNGVAPATSPPSREQARRELGLEGQGRWIGLFGQLVPHKGALQFIHAARAALRRDADLRFALAGAGPESFLAQVRDEIKRSPAGRIRLLPPQPNASRLMAAVDGVCVPTVTPDPLPRAILEAMAAGLPVVAFRSGGAPELIEHGATGLLVEPGNLNGLAAAFERLANGDLAEVMGAAGRVRASRDFTIDRHVDRMERILGDAVRR
jgi:glycosyltransferase involved in cell wall biosynthesis